MRGVLSLPTQGHNRVASTHSRDVAAVNRRSRRSVSARATGPSGQLGEATAAAVQQAWATAGSSEFWSSLPPHYGTAALRQAFQNDAASAGAAQSQGLQLVQERLSQLNQFSIPQQGSADRAPVAVDQMMQDYRTNVADLLQVVAQLAAELQAKLSSVVGAGLTSLPEAVSSSLTGDWNVEPHWGTHEFISTSQKLLSWLSTLAMALVGDQSSPVLQQLLQSVQGTIATASASLTAATASLASLGAGSLDLGEASSSAAAAAAHRLSNAASSMSQAAQTLQAAFSDGANFQLPNLDTLSPDALSLQMQSLAVAFQGFPDLFSNLPAPFLGGYDPATITVIAAGECSTPGIACLAIRPAWLCADVPSLQKRRLHQGVVF